MYVYTVYSVSLVHAFVIVMPSYSLYISYTPQVLAMISSNEAVPDIEKLERSEFILDTEEHLRHKGEEEKRIGEVREEIELDNLAKMYLRDKIKKQCWDSMEVKGKAVKVHTLYMYNVCKINVHAYVCCAFILLNTCTHYVDIHNSTVYIVCV